VLDRRKLVARRRLRRHRLKGAWCEERLLTVNGIGQELELEPRELLV
jgi:hypothetical protein